MDEHHGVIVIGAGVFGLSAAIELADRGYDVAILDRYGSGHELTSSTGRSRGIRYGYDHPLYVELALDGIERWRKLEASSGRRILHLTGQVDIGPNEKLDDIVSAVRAAGAEIDELDSVALQRLMPYLKVDANQRGTFQRLAGTVLSDEGMAALMDAARVRGIACLMPERVVGVEGGERPSVTTERRHLTADHVVVAAGPWSGELLATAGIAVPLAPAVAQVTFVSGQELVDLPGFGEWSGDEGLGGVYGHPVPGIGYKLAFSTGQDVWSNDTTKWQPDGNEQVRLLSWLERRMPGFPSDVVRTQRHPWTMTPDGDFIIDRRGKLVFACGCSGHAFKFGPALGPLVADVVDGKAPVDLFRLDRPTLDAAAIADATITR